MAVVFPAVAGARNSIRKEDRSKTNGETRKRRIPRIQERERERERSGSREKKKRDQRGVSKRTRGLQEVYIRTD